MNCGKFFEIRIACDDDEAIFFRMSPNGTIVSLFQSDQGDLGASGEVILQKRHKSTR